MRIIVGLGNPGSGYARNRHNIGFMAVDALHDRHPGFGPWRKRFQAEVAEGMLAGEKVLLLKPATYMNESGRAVGEALRFYKLTPADVIVFYDELDLAPGKVRLKTGGGSGGHNGIRSLDAHIGKDYLRVRLGIGHPGHKDRVTAHVLGDFAKADQPWLEPLLDALAGEADLLLSDKPAEFCNRLHLALAPAGGKGQAPKRPSAGAPAASSSPRTQKAAASGANAQAPRPAGPLAEGLARLLGKKGTD
ncbi:aminoacyl-tRNA hydrolase [Stappia taiwanensis]|uniref:Peptidyl-tRNA hydrolase n=1 Tax=Stappia taiwanensis TaxID=992267 RepID=A0A838XQ89_9HYPH|nr:aminoacyl-tRNA hydrolase [Stappia taiwanensis]MBA4611221.1 aminoacyl-tRNA hydrolase [Stappia taiwanensis]GGE86874.1 peptidyl-tRNA hydrolase [Stappia taiwanensis]